MTGAFETGIYRNVFKECSYTEAEIEQRVEDTFRRIFHGTKEECFYHEVGEDMAYVEAVSYTHLDVYKRQTCF